jgi:hypothetical protein
MRPHPADPPAPAPSGAAERLGIRRAALSPARSGPGRAGIPPRAAASPAWSGPGRGGASRHQPRGARPGPARPRPCRFPCADPLPGTPRFKRLPPIRRAAQLSTAPRECRYSISYRGTPARRPDPMPGADPSVCDRCARVAGDVGGGDGGHDRVNAGRVPATRAAGLRADHDHAVQRQDRAAQVAAGFFPAAVLRDPLTW